MRLLTTLAVAIVLSGCATTKQPMITSAAIIPNQLQPGDTAVISVQIEDKFGVVTRVEGVVKEDPTLNFKLLDDGQAPDAAAGDGIWTLEVAVPFNAPPGDFQFNLVAYDDSGSPVLIRDENGEVMTLNTNFTLNITIPPQQ